MMLKVSTGAALVFFCLAASACQVKKTEDGKLPDVSVQATGGQLPKYDVQGPEVKVGTKTTTVQVPTVEVKTPAEKK
jgi:hypothetical protein